MKKLHPNFIQVILISTISLLAFNGCSSMPGDTASSKDIAAVGPTILNVRLEPSTVELDQNLQPLKAPEITADVKDFRSKVSNVTLKFTHVPMQVPMQNIGGTTWRAVLTLEQLQTLAVSGKTINYDASIIARNQEGQIVESHEPLKIAIKAPDVIQRHA